MPVQNVVFTYALKSAMIEHQDLLRANNLEEFYKQIRTEDSSLIAEFTEVLYKSGINPLEHLKAIPANFANVLELKEIENIVIPSTITEIGPHAFAAASVKRIYIPKSVTSIGNNAFVFSMLDDCYYEGTEEEAERIELKKRVPEETKIHYNVKEEEVIRWKKT